MLHAILHGAPDCRAPGGANGLSVDFQNDACIPEGFQFQTFVGGQYAPQGADRLVEVDVGVDQVVAPYFRGQEIPFTDVVFPLQEQFEQLDMPASDFVRFILHDDRHFPAIDITSVRDAHDVVVSGAGQDRFEAHFYFRQVGVFADVIVGPRLKPLDCVPALAQRSQ